MMTESLRHTGANGSPPTVPRRSPPKRSFDVAFLTGAGDESPSEEEDPKEERQDETPNLKILKNLDKNSVDDEKAHLSPNTIDDFQLQRQAYLKGDSTSLNTEKSSCGSAFTKVFRPQTSSSPPSRIPGLDVASSLQATWPPTSTSFSAMSSLLSGSKTFSPLIGGSSFLPHALAPLLNPVAATSAAAQESLNNNLVEEYLKSQHQIMSKNSAIRRSDITSSEALSRLRSTVMHQSDHSFKLPFGGIPYAALGSGSPTSKLHPSPFLPQSPVSALIPPSMSTMSLAAQNVCAKCNISFRMTSDLVYHMRSQHKRETDVFRKRRNEKLKCSICGEAFRERHHLTRHMTAHQDRANESEVK